MSLHFVPNVLCKISSTDYVIDEQSKTVIKTKQRLQTNEYYWIFCIPKKIEILK